MNIRKSPDDSGRVMQIAKKSLSRLASYYPLFLCTSLSAWFVLEPQYLSSEESILFVDIIDRKGESWVFIDEGDEVMPAQANTDPIELSPAEIDTSQSGYYLDDLPDENVKEDSTEAASPVQHNDHGNGQDDEQDEEDESDDDEDDDGDSDDNDDSAIPERPSRQNTVIESSENRDDELEDRTIENDLQDDEDELGDKGSIDRFQNSGIVLLV